MVRKSAGRENACGISRFLTVPDAWGLSYFNYSSCEILGLRRSSMSRVQLISLSSRCRRSSGNTSDELICYLWIRSCRSPGVHRRASMGLIDRLRCVSFHSCRKSISGKLSLQLQCMYSLNVCTHARSRECRKTRESFSSSTWSQWIVPLYLFI